MVHSLFTEIHLYKGMNSCTVRPKKYEDPLPGYDFIIIIYRTSKTFLFFLVCERKTTTRGRDIYARGFPRGRTSSYFNASCVSGLSAVGSIEWPRTVSSDWSY